jgi:hypothetical protein
MGFTHRTTAEFWASYDNLSLDIQKTADKNYELLKTNPRHPSLQFKKVGAFWSARVSLNHRTLAFVEDNEFVWFWIGTHAEYDRLI